MQFLPHQSITIIAITASPFLLKCPHLLIYSAQDPIMMEHYSIQKIWLYRLQLQVIDLLPFHVFNLSLRFDILLLNVSYLCSLTLSLELYLSFHLICLSISINRWVGIQDILWNHYPDGPITRSVGIDFYPYVLCFRIQSDRLSQSHTPKSHPTNQSVSRYTSKIAIFHKLICSLYIGPNEGRSNWDGLLINLEPSIVGHTYFEIPPLKYFSLVRIIYNINILFYPNQLISIFLSPLLSFSFLLQINHLFSSTSLRAKSWNSWPRLFLSTHLIYSMGHLYLPKYWCPNRNWRRDGKSAVYLILNI